MQKQQTPQLNQYEKKLKRQVLEQKPKKRKTRQAELKRLKTLAKDLDEVQQSRNAPSH
jgi:hypothetical protein